MTVQGLLPNHSLLGLTLRIHLPGAFTIGSSKQHFHLSVDEQGKVNITLPAQGRQETLQLDLQDNISCY